MGMIIRAIIFFGLWEAWKTRCKMKFEDERVDVRWLLRKVYTQVYDLNLILIPKRTPTTLDKIYLESLRVTAKNGPVKRGKWLSWSKPEAHRYKLNVDGSRKGYSSSGGGVVRDDHGDVVCAFSNPYDTDDIIEAEIRALLDGINMCGRNGITNVNIEFDASLVVNGLDFT